MTEGRKALAVFAGVAVVAAAGVVLATRVLRIAAGPEAEILTALKATEDAPLRVQVPGAREPLVSSRHLYQRIVVDVDRKGSQARAIATLDFDGVLGATRVSSLGLERIPWRREAGEWVAPEGFAPVLARVVGALERRRSALDGGDPSALAALGPSAEDASSGDPEIRRLLAISERRYRALAWYIRTERDQVLVTEEYRLLGYTPERPVDESGARRLVLRERNGEFLFAAGLR